MTIELTSRSEADTRAIGRNLASFLSPGDVVLLAGDLGAGKTAFAAGLAEGLGIEEPVISPSFMLVRRYAGGFLPLTHADVYRLGSMNELEDLDLFVSKTESFPKHIYVVGAHFGSGPISSARAVVEYRCDCGNFQLESVHGDPLEHASGLEMGILDHIGDVVDGPAGHFCPLQDLEHLVGI